MEWKEANVLPIYNKKYLKKKKEDKQGITNYRPASLLPICSKNFERILFNELYKFLNEIDLLSPN